MCPSEVLELGDELCVTAEGELRLDAVLDRSHAHLFEPFDRCLGKRLVAQVGKRVSAPERERTREAVGGSGRIATCKRIQAVVHPTLESRQVDLLGIDGDDVAGTA